MESIYVWKAQSLLLQNFAGWKRASFIKRLGTRSEGYVDPKFSSDMMLLEDSDDAGWEKSVISIEFGSLRHKLFIYIYVDVYVYIYTHVTYIS